MGWWWCGLTRDGPATRIARIAAAAKRAILRGGAITNNDFGLAKEASMAFVLALDQGTTSSRAILFDRAGTVHAVAQREFAQLFPQPGWVEHDPMEVWARQSGVMAEVLAKAAIAPTDIAAIGITNQRETTVLWERATGRPVANAIDWQDRSTAPLCDALRAAGHETTFARKTGPVLDAYFSGTKLRWLLDHVAQARSRAERGELAFGTVDSWLIWNLSGGTTHVTDPSNASRTLLFDIHRGEWDDELLALLDVPRAVLPAVVASSGVCAHATLGGAAVPIAGIAGDQQAALFGQACLEPGLAKNTYGTGCFLLLNTGRTAVTSKNHLLSTVAWRRDGTTDYALEGSVFIAGAVVQWLRDGLKIIRSAAEVEALAASVPDNGGVYLVPAFAGLGAPHWDAYARGAILGLTRGATGGLGQGGPAQQSLGVLTFSRLANPVLQLHGPKKVHILLVRCICVYLVSP